MNTQGFKKMNIKKSTNKIDADDLIINLRFNFKENLILYLKEIWKVFIHILSIRTYH